MENSNSRTWREKDGQEQDQMTGNKMARGAGSFPQSRNLGTSNVALPNLQKALGSITSTEQFESGRVLG